MPTFSFPKEKVGGLEGLLRPGSDMCQTRYSRLYSEFYQQYGTRATISTGEVIQTLKVLTPEERALEVRLLGQHGPGAGGNQQANSDVAAPCETLARIAQDFRRAATGSEAVDRRL